MEHRPVKSESLRSVGYEDGILEVTYGSSARRNEPGKTYQYKDPEGAVSRGADGAKSKGHSCTVSKAKLTYRKKGTEKWLN